MIPVPKIIEIMERLLEKSRRDEVNWRETAYLKVRPTFRGEYFVEFPESIFAISYHSPQTEPDEIHVQILRQNRDVVSAFTLDEQSDHWEVANELFTEARRHVTGWDRVLSDLEQAVNRIGVIGIDAESSARGASTETATETEDDIPF